MIHQEHGSGLRSRKIGSAEKVLLTEGVLSMGDGQAYESFAGRNVKVITDRL